MCIFLQFEIYSYDRTESLSGLKISCATDCSVSDVTDCSRSNVCCHV